MPYKTLMAHVQLEHDNSNVHAIAAALAATFDAGVIGIAGIRLAPPFTEVPVAELTNYEMQAAEQALKNQEKAFREAFRNSKAAISWRSSRDFVPVSDFISTQARAADLIITGPQSNKFLDRIGETHIGAMVLQAGRPVLIVPERQRELKLDKIVIAWKDTREARRGAADALPFLLKAGEVVVAHVCLATDLTSALASASDVTNWLKAQGVTARAAVHVHDGNEISGLRRLLDQENCDLIVAGAYGHARLREWIFSGVTMDLLLPGARAVLLSH